MHEHLNSRTINLYVRILIDFMGGQKSSVNLFSKGLYWAMFSTTRVTLCFAVLYFFLIFQIVFCSQKCLLSSHYSLLHLAGMDTVVLLEGMDTVVLLHPGLLYNICSGGRMNSWITIIFLLAFWRNYSYHTQQFVTQNIFFHQRVYPIS